MKIDLIVIHCSLTKADQNIGANEIRLWHVNDNGWDDIGYHYVITRPGWLEIGRPAFVQGAHALAVNARSIGICLVGGLGADGECEDNFSVAQRNCLSEVLRMLLRLIPSARVVGHRDVDPTRGCPCFDLEGYCRDRGLPYGIRAPDILLREMRAT